MILLQADMLELKANPEELARGVIIEARLEALCLQARRLHETMMKNGMGRH